MLILPVILSCIKNKHLWKNIIEKIPNCVIFCGVPNLKKNYMLNNNILFLKCNDNYEGLPEKIIAMISTILEVHDFDKYTHIFKMDDHDTKIPHNFSDNLKTIENKDYIGQKLHNAKNVCRTWHFNKCSNDYKYAFTPYKGVYTPWLDGGCGYILSRNAMEKINLTFNFKNLTYIKNFYIYEDLMIALILKKYNIYPSICKKIIQGDK
jgi:hypothetical protein